MGRFVREGGRKSRPAGGRSPAAVGRVMDRLCRKGCASRPPPRSKPGEMRLGACLPANGKPEATGCVLVHRAQSPEPPPCSPPDSCARRPAADAACVPAGRCVAGGDACVHPPRHQFVESCPREGQAGAPRRSRASACAAWPPTAPGRRTASPAPCASSASTTVATSGHFPAGLTSRMPRHATGGFRALARQAHADTRTCRRKNAAASWDHQDRLEEQKLPFLAVLV